MSFGTGTGFTFGAGAAGTAQKQPLFGGFGATPAAAAATTSTPSFSFNLGSSLPQANRPTSLVAPSQATTSLPATGFSFGAANPQPSTSQPSLGLFGGGAGVFGSTLGNSSTGFGLGTASSTSGLNLAGASTGFGTGLGGLTGTSSLFGQPQTSGTGLFSTLGTSSLQPQPQQQMQQQISQQQQLKTSLTNPQIFNDERDNLMAKWNQLQAAFGRGKAYYSSTAPPIELSTSNPYCCFKTIAYNHLPDSDNSDGHITLILDKKLSELAGIHTQLTEKLVQLLGSKPGITFSAHLVSLKATAENKTEAVLYIAETIQATGQSRHIPSSDISQFLNQSTNKAQLAAVRVTSVFPRVALSKDQLNQYLSVPPPGIELVLWEQAKRNNPDKTRFIPVPVVGFQQLHQRVTAQQLENQVQQQELERLEGKVQVLNQKHTNIENRVNEYKRQLGALTHRLLRVFAKLHCHHHQGQAITELEEQMLARLQSIDTHLNTNPNLRSRTHDLMNEMRHKSEMERSAKPAAISYTVDEDTEGQVTKHLSEQQNMIKEIGDIFNKDMKDIQTLTAVLDVHS